MRSESKTHGNRRRTAVFPTTIISRLESPNLRTRLTALTELRQVERRGMLKLPVGPVLPSYNHIHTSISYGDGVPGVFSVARMIWAAHEARAFSTLIIEHESVDHLYEAERAAMIVNRGMSAPLRLALGVEFKAPVAMDSAAARQFSASLAGDSGQGEAAWVVGIGARPSTKLSELVAIFQQAKTERAAAQLERLNKYFGFEPKLKLAALGSPNGNVTDRQLCIAVAQARWPGADDATLLQGAGAIRKLLNPGGPGFVRYPRRLPSYQDVIRTIRALGMIPTFTAQLRLRALRTHLPLLKSWGIEALDVAGIEPDEPDAIKTIREFIALAQAHKLAVFGGSDYRGFGTGWTKHASWMDHPLMRKAIVGITNRIK